MPNPSFIIITPLSGEYGLLLPPYSIRGATQTLEWIGGDQYGRGVRESINGKLINLFPIQFRKLQSVISAKDVQTPALDDAYIGQVVQVECAAELSYLTGGTPQRTEVSGSSRVDGHYTFYRPLLTMMLTAAPESSFDEYNATYSWSMTFREVQRP